MTNPNPWVDWINQLPKAQAALLAGAAVENKLASPYKNGHGSFEDPVEDHGGIPSAASHTIEKRETELLRPTALSFIDEEAPPYVDVHHLVDLYNSVAYKHNLLVKGPKGDGKSLSFVHFAALTKTPRITLNCSEDTKEKHMVGNFVIRPGKTAGSIESPWVLGALATSIDVANEYGRAILVLEEVNALTPQIQKQLNSLLDFRKDVNIAQLARSFSLRKDAFLWVVATMNPSVYGGTYELNEDLRSRWVELEVDYPNKTQEKLIIDANVKFDNTMSPTMTQQDWDKIVDQCLKLANETRTGNTQYALSSRDIVSLVKLIQDIGLEKALQLIVCKFEGDDRKTIIARVTAIFAGMYPKESWGK